MQSYLTKYEGWITHQEGLYFRKLQTSVDSVPVLPLGNTLETHYDFYQILEDSESGSILKKLGGSATISESGSLSSPSNTPMKFILGSKSCIEALEFILSEPRWDIRQADTLEILSDSKFAFGAVGSPPHVPPNAVVLFRIHINSVKSETKQISDFIAASKQLKDQGNKLFQQSSYKEASNTYAKAIQNLRFIFSEREEEEKELNAIRLVCYGNRAACQLKLQEWPGAKQSCNSALYLDPQNVKALYRRAQAQCAMFDFERAKKDIIAAVKLSPNDANLRDEYSKIKQLHKEYEKRAQEALSQASKSMFS